MTLAPGSALHGKLSRCFLEGGMAARAIGLLTLGDGLHGDEVNRKERRTKKRGPH